MTDSVRVLILVLFLAMLEISELFAVRREGSDVFAPKIGWRLFYFITIVAFLNISIEHVRSAPHPPAGPPLWFSLLALLLFVFARPQSLVVSSQGLASYRLWGFSRRFIPWTEVSGVTSDWEEQATRVWTFMGYKVAVTSRDGTRIEHTILHKRQGKFLDDLRQFVPATAFAPGLFDWHR